MKKLISILTLALAIICFISTESPTSDSNATTKKLGFTVYSRIIMIPAINTNNWCIFFDC